MLVFILLIIFIPQKIDVVTCVHNNACTNYYSYLNIHFSRDCYHIPDNGNSVPTIIQRHIGVVETHHVTTSQGYVLTLFRIPRESPKGVILFQHGIGQDSRAWVAQYNQSVAFLFWHSGYDIWLNNHRGTYYSKKHVKLTPDDEEFWDFSIEEMGYHDTNDVIEYVKRTTNVDKIIYVGHSLGGSIGLVYASLRPNEAENSVKMMVLVSPVVSHRSGRTPVALLFGLFSAFLKNNLHKVFKWYNSPGYDSVFLTTLRTLNGYFPFKYFNVFLVAFFCGGTPNEFDPNYINLMVDQSGSAAPLKIFTQFYQLNKSNSNFSMYDYGTKGNIMNYGTVKPPLFPLEKIKNPIFTIYGEHDLFYTKKDAEVLYGKLQPAVRIHGQKEVKGFNHIDYFWGKHREVLVYSEILKVLND